MAAARWALARAHGWSCSAREPLQPLEHRARLVELLQLRERLDEVRRDREDAGLVDAVLDSVRPDGAEGVGRRGGLAREQQRLAARAQRLEPVPADADLGGGGDRPGRPRLGLGGAPPSRGEERAAALVHRLDEQLGLGRLRPLGEQRLGRVPVAGAEVQLAEVEPLQGVGHRLALLVGRA